MISDQLVTKYDRNKCRLLCPDSNDTSRVRPGRGLTTKETERTATIHPLVVFPRVKQMFNQSSYRFQKSQCDKCSWKLPANRATSDWTWPRFRKRNKEPPIRSKSWRYEQRREEVPILRINSPSLGHRFCLYLLLHINYSIEAGSRKDKLILFTVQDQFMYLKIYICKLLVPPFQTSPCLVSATETHLSIKNQSINQNPFKSEDTLSLLCIKH